MLLTWTTFNWKFKWIENLSAMKDCQTKDCFYKKSIVIKI